MYHSINDFTSTEKYETENFLLELKFKEVKISFLEFIVLNPDHRDVSYMGFGVSNPNSFGVTEISELDLSQLRATKDKRELNELLYGLYWKVSIIEDACMS